MTDVATAEPVPSQTTPVVADASPASAPAASVISSTPAPVETAAVVSPAPVATVPAPVVEPVVAPAVEPVAEAAPAEPAKPEEEAAPEKEAVLEAPKYTEFTMPKGFEAPAETINAYTNILGKYGIPQEAGQELVEFHAAALQKASAQIAQENSQRAQDVFADTNKKWVAAVDKEFGNKRNTVVENAKWVGTEYSGTKAQQKEFWEALNQTGAGNHPAVIRTFNNISKALRERQAPTSGLPVNGAKSGPAWERRYKTTA